MAKQEQPDYHCSQQELYTALRKGWANVLLHIALFMAYSPRLDGAMVAAEVLLIDTAENLPDAATRQEARELAHIKLKAEKDEYVELWADLKDHVENTYPEVEWSTKLKAAGKEHYDKARGGNWQSMKSLIKNADEFLTANSAKMIADNVMPAGFPGPMTGLGKTFNDTFTIFDGFRGDAKQGTTDKIKENNKIYKRYLNVVKAARRVFRNDPEKMASFNFPDLVNSISGTGQAGTRGLIIDSVTKLPIKNVIIEFTVPKTTFFKSTKTDDKGEFLLTVPHQNYVMTIKADGYRTIVVDDHTVKLGTISRFDVTMVAV